jgi:hypothetical protein
MPVASAIYPATQAGHFGISTSMAPGNAHPADFRQRLAKAGDRAGAWQHVDRFTVNPPTPARIVPSNRRSRRHGIGRGDAPNR